MTTKHVGALPRTEWPSKTVADIMTSCAPEKVIQADTDAHKALAQMNKVRSSRLLVLDGDRLVGMITLKDLLKHLAFRMNLEEMAKAGGVTNSRGLPYPQLRCDARRY